MDNSLYSLVFRAVFAPMDAERAHHLSFTALRGLDSLPGLRAAFGAVLSAGTDDPVEVLGLPFRNRVGLAAGFDKEGGGVRALSRLGFGHIEIGTVTGQAQPGNERPRLFRLLAHDAILNRMGFNNAGSHAAAAAVEQQRDLVEELPASRRPIIGVNIGKTKVVEAADAASDYAVSTRELAPLADYLVINVSSPNTPGLRDLQAADSLRPIITAVRDTAAKVVAAPRSTLGHVPLLVKLAPDLADGDVRELVDLAIAERVDGLVLTNTTIDREVLTGADRDFARGEAGGISGRPLAARSMEVLRLVRAHLDRAHPGSPMALVSAGGVGDARDVAARLGAGADLVQAYSGLIYGGPTWPGQVVRGSRGGRRR
ncbi:MAG: quinone-dependent dihydroorotate dehydrogenase [Brevibacterium yomogidense]|uniref:quinone-dependent dihydroorotate dehydrogenase n=1 Tax=Brevibacterium sp. Mu109 TaxID=1255669 RepID=UPI000C756D46|nr:quinone-dependent dihydroorotate dehydrogenase [Brevibacterium sp. Mu109]